MNETQVTAAPGAAPAAAPAAAVETQAVEGAASVDQAAQQQPGFMQTLGPMPMMLLLLALFYFMFWRPQQRKEKERRKMIEELRAGAKVIFAGGIVGTIVEAKEKSLVVETAPGTTMEILRSAVQGACE